MFETSFWELAQMTRAVLPKMRGQRKGFIVNAESDKSKLTALNAKLTAAKNAFFHCVRKNANGNRAKNFYLELLKLLRENPL